MYAWTWRRHSQIIILHNFASLSLGAKYNQATNEAVEQAISLGIHFAVAGTYFR